MKKMIVGLVAVVGVALSALAVRNVVVDGDFNEAHPPPGDLIPADRGLLHIVAQGPVESPRGVVLVHGNPGTALDFALVQGILGPQYRSLAVDRPGYGWSDRPSNVMSPHDQAEHIRIATRALGVERPILVGFSYGGPVVLSWAIAHPNEVRGLVLVAAVGDPGTPIGASPSQALLAKPLFGPALAWTLAPFFAPSSIEAGYTNAFFPVAPDPDTVSRGKLLIARPVCLMSSAFDWAVLEETFAELGSHFKELRMPVEILSAEDDRVVSMAHGEHLASTIPGAIHTRFPKAGHGFTLTHADAIAQAVSRILSRSSTVSAP